MEFLDQLIKTGSGFVPLMLGLVITFVIFWVAEFAFIRRLRKQESEHRVLGQIIYVFIFIFVLTEVIILVPMSDELRQQVLNLLGLVLTGVMAVSSTTFVSNAMAGLMLRIVGSFKEGDFIRVGEQFGRVSERGLFHSEIQTEDRDLTTLPNLKLITHPVTVVHHTGTIVSANVSLGYDLPAKDIEMLLKQAAEECGLSDPFVQIKELGDFSITYRIAGFYPEVKQLITMKSDLHKSILHKLHGAGMEIVSPAFMNQRRISHDEPIIPDTSQNHPPTLYSPENFPEDLMFDKANLAGSIQQLKESKAQLALKIQDTKAAIKSKSVESTEDQLLYLASMENRLEFLTRQIEILSEDISKH